MKYLYFYVIASLLITSSLTDSAKLKDVLKRSKNNNTNYSEENDDIFRKEILNLKNQCSRNNSESNDNNRNYQNYGNSQNYDQKYYGESHGRYNRNNQDDYQSSGYNGNNYNGRGNSDYGMNNDQGYSTNSGYGYYNNNNNRDSNYNNNNGQSSGMPGYNNGYSSNGYNTNGYNSNNGGNYNNGNMESNNVRHNGHNDRNQNSYYGIRNNEDENCENENAGRRPLNRQHNNQRNGYGSYYSSNDHPFDITGYYNGGRLKRSGKITPEDKYSFQCISQCIFGHLEMLDDEQVPSETLFVKWIQEHIQNDDLKRIQTLREVRKCFARMSTSDIEDGCDFSKELSKCLNLELE